MSASYSEKEPVPQHVSPMHEHLALYGGARRHGHVLLHDRVPVAGQPRARRDGPLQRDAVARVMHDGRPPGPRALVRFHHDGKRKLKHGLLDKPQRAIATHEPRREQLRPPLQLPKPRLGGKCRNRLHGVTHQPQTVRDACNVAHGVLRFGSHAIHAPFDSDAEQPVPVLRAHAAEVVRKSRARCGPVPVAHHRAVAFVPRGLDEGDLRVARANDEYGLCRHATLPSYSANI